MSAPGRTGDRQRALPLLLKDANEGEIHMLQECGCLCAAAEHHGICQGLATARRTHVIKGLTITPRATVCEACYEAVLERRLAGQTRANSAVR